MPNDTKLPKAFQRALHNLRHADAELREGAADDVVGAMLALLSVAGDLREVADRLTVEAQRLEAAHKATGGQVTDAMRRG